MKFSRTHILLGVAALLATLLLLDRGETPAPDVVAPRAPSQARPPGAGPAGLPTGNPLAGVRLAELADTVGRPLFEPSRRPFERSRPAPAAAPVPIAKPAAPPEEPRFKLLGVIMDGSRSLALLATGDGRSQRLEVGDAVDGWQVDSIKLSEVVLSRSGRKLRLSLSKR